MRPREAINHSPWFQKNLEWVIKQSGFKYLEDGMVIKSSSLDFVKNRSCQTSLISLFNRVAGLVNKEEQVEVIYLSLSTWLH